MIEVIENLLIGSQLDYENNVKFQLNWYVIQACKEPYHREALGYSGRAFSSTHPEYLIARRENRLILNLVDGNDHRYFSSEILDTALDEVDKNINDNRILVHCNQGCSRSPMIGLLYMVRKGRLPSSSFLEAEIEFSKIYPPYNPAKGIRDFAIMNWSKYSN